MPPYCTGLKESVHQSEGLRSVVTCEHAALPQRAASKAQLHEAPHVCLLMLVGVAQANSRIIQERPVRTFVSSVLKVRVGCRRRGMSCPLTQSSLCVYVGGGCSTRIHVDSGKYRGLVRLCGVIRWPAGLLYAPRGALLAY
jgi:hypothetical protein